MCAIMKNKKELVQLAKNLRAVSLEYELANQLQEERKRLDLIAISYGTYGFNAKIWQDYESKQFYYIDSRTSVGWMF